MSDIKDLKASIDLLRSQLFDGPGLFICRTYISTCSKCPCNAGPMAGGCCKGLLTAALRHLTMFHRGGCDFKAAQKRLDTLADYLETAIERLENDEHDKKFG